MDWSFIIKFTPLFIKAAITTIKVATAGILLSLVIGLICSTIQYLRIPILKGLVNIYVELSRNTPLIVQLYFLYYGLPKVGIKLDSELCAVIGLTFLGGSYMTEALRSGLNSIEKNQYEAGLSIGLNHRQIVQYIVLPQAFSVSIPAICANILFLIKETSVFSVVALADLMYVAKELIGIYYLTKEALFMLIMFYLIILLPISNAASYLERRLRHARFGN